MKFINYEMIKIKLLVNSFLYSLPHRALSLRVTCGGSRVVLHRALSLRVTCDGSLVQRQGSGSCHAP